MKCVTRGSFGDAHCATFVVHTPHTHTLARTGNMQCTFWKLMSRRNFNPKWQRRRMCWIPFWFRHLFSTQHLLFPQTLCYDAAQIGFAPNHPHLLRQRFQKLWHLDGGHTTQLWTEFASVIALGLSNNLDFCQPSCMHVGSKIYQVSV